MRISSFWPPRRTWDRAAAELYQRRRREEGVPWLSKAAIESLGGLLKPTDRCLDWGSGASTVWLARRTATVVGVEHDAQWSLRVSSWLGREGRENGSVLLLSDEPGSDPRRSPYVRAIDQFEPGELDVCLVDGQHRAECVLEAMPRLAPGGLLLIDDAQLLFDQPTRSPHSRYGRGAPTPQWAAIADQLAEWRMIWCSDGYSDAGIWIKPGSASSGSEDAALAASELGLPAPASTRSRARSSAALA